MRTEHDLLKKLEHDFQRLVTASNPIAHETQYAAFDFFVTAEHMCDWHARATSTEPNQHRDYPWGRLVWDVASGAKHFSLDDARHTTTKAGRVDGGFFGGTFFGDRFFGGGGLVIDLEDGRSVAVLDIAESVLQHWRATVAGPSAELPSGRLRRLQ